MILIAFATNTNRDTPKKGSELALLGAPEDNLLDTGFRSAKTNKTGQIVRSETAQEDTLISTHPLDQLKNLFERLQEELANKRIARKESLELETLIDLNNLILKNLATNIITAPLKDLIVSAVTQQKEILAEYLKEDSKSNLTKEQQSIKDTIKNLDRNLNLITEQNSRTTTTVASVNQASATEVLLDPVSFSFHERRTLVTAAKEREQAEVAQAKVQVEEQRQAARNAAELRVLREYVTRLDNDEARINFVSALYQQRKDPAILTIVTDVLSKETPSLNEGRKIAPIELSLAN